VQRGTKFGATKQLASASSLVHPAAGRSRGKGDLRSQTSSSTVPHTTSNKTQPVHQRHFCLRRCCLRVVNRCRAGGSEQGGTSCRYVQNPFAIRRTRGKAANHSQLPTPEHQQRETPSSGARSMARPSLPRPRRQANAYPRMCTDVSRCSVFIRSRKLASTP
jgi:hypothetical protein